jgi:hypothetical protein
MTEEEFLKKCIKICKSSPSDDAKKEIANMKHPLKNEKVGFERAEKVYYHYLQNYAVKYDIKKYCNNEKEYINKVKNLT